MFLPKERIFLEDGAFSADGFAAFGWQRAHRATLLLDSHTHPHRHEFVFVISGNVEFEVDYRTYKLTGGDVFHTHPDVWHSSASVPLSLSEFYWFQLDVSRAETFLSLSPRWGEELISSLKQIQNHVIKADVDALQPLFKELKRLLCAPDQNLRAITSLLVHILYKLLEYDSQTKFSLTPEIGAVMEHVLSNLSEHISLEQLAALCHMSVSRFKIKFKEQIGVGPREFINHCKVQEAKQLLLSGMPVTEVAMALAFSSSSYFAYVFRQFTSISPTEYAAQQRGA